jgi:hypothetical protein
LVEWSWLNSAQAGFGVWTCHLDTIEGARAWRQIKASKVAQR